MDDAILMERFCHGDLNALRAIVHTNTKKSKELEDNKKTQRNDELERNDKCTGSMPT
jgi:hypothetical protein